ncbi:MAG: right-handed parallel beta-helix repeat-containing protein [Bacteroidales bacterium]|nr:right-handed parallel beta-helix repeat-containing protein [Bacteroidales bacterium]
MKIFRRILLLCILIVPPALRAAPLTSVRLEDYGDIKTPEAAGETFIRALNDIAGKRLVLPPVPIRITRDYTLKDCRKFEIVGSPYGGHIECKIFMLLDCRDFVVDGLSFQGTREQFASFYVIGDCRDFEIRNCSCDSEKDLEGNNTFYGIHVCGRADDPGASYANSPRHFKIHDNVVRNTRYDGILVHGHCSDFVIEKNTVIAPQCIGIEVEGRFGELRTTTVHRCRRGVVRNNFITDCGDWGILLMWSDNIVVTDNESRNAVGTFLSIGCKDLRVTRNILEGTRKGFEISQEFFAIEKGINEHVVVRNNEISCIARADGRGAVDIRHSRDVVFRGNKVKVLGRASSGAINVSSSIGVKITDNEFIREGDLPHYAVICGNVLDPETGKDVPGLDLTQVRIARNKLPLEFKDMELKLPEGSEAVNIRGNSFRDDQ